MTALRGSEPVGFKSGRAVWFYKGKGAMDSCSSYRAILLLPSLGESLAPGYAPPLKEHFLASSPELQLGGKTGISVSIRQSPNTGELLDTQRRVAGHTLHCSLISPLPFIL